MPMVWGFRAQRMMSAALSALLVAGGGAGAAQAQPQGGLPLSAEAYMVVDCLLPGQVRKLGRVQTFITPRRPARTSATACEIRGGEYVAADRATFASSLAVWLPSAQAGDAKAQAYVGRIYAEGFDRAPDFAQAASWYRKAADQGFPQAMIDLGQLYERGKGVPHDAVRAVELYRQATGIPAGAFGKATAVTAPAGPDPAITRELEAARQALAEERSALARTRAELARATAGNRDAAAAQQRVLAARSAELEAARIEKTRLADELAAAKRVAEQGGRASAQEADARARAQAELGERDARLRASEARVAALQKEVAIARDAGAASNKSLAERETRLAQREEKIREIEAKLHGALGGYRSAPATSVGAAAPTRMPASSKMGFNQAFALLIGESDYKDPKLGKLATPANDVKQLGALLKDRYGFIVNVALNKSRAEILRELDLLAQKVGENDTLIIYYAGHGGMEKVRNGEARGYWLPIDAELGGSAGQISNQEITYQVARMAARKVLIVADSCYSGLLTQTVSRAQRPAAEEVTVDYLIGMARKQSRNVLTSGGLEPVLDGGGPGNHSVFAAALIDVLKTNNDILTSDELHSRLVRRVMSNATSALLADQDVPDPQQPTYAALDNGGHVYGDFLFVPKASATGAATFAALHNDARQTSLAGSISPP